MELYIDKACNFVSNFFRTINVFKIVDYKMHNIYNNVVLYLIIKYYKFNINTVY